MQFRAFPAVNMLKNFNYEAPEALGQIAPSAAFLAVLLSLIENVNIVYFLLDDTFC